LYHVKKDSVGRRFAKFDFVFPMIECDVLLCPLKWHVVYLCICYIRRCMCVFCVQSEVRCTCCDKVPIVSRHSEKWINTRRSCTSILTEHIHTLNSKGKDREWKKRNYIEEEWERCEARRKLSLTYQYHELKGEYLLCVDEGECEVASNPRATRYSSS
jgi:hypothetical protein